MMIWWEDVYPELVWWWIIVSLVISVWNNFSRESRQSVYPVIWKYFIIIIIIMNLFTWRWLDFNICLCGLKAAQTVRKLKNISVHLSIFSHLTLNMNIWICLQLSRIFGAVVVLRCWMHPVVSRIKASFWLEKVYNDWSSGKAAFDEYLCVDFWKRHFKFSLSCFFCLEDFWASDAFSVLIVFH